LLPVTAKNCFKSQIVFFFFSPAVVLRLVIQIVQQVLQSCGPEFEVKVLWVIVGVGSELIINDSEKGGINHLPRRTLAAT
jgi:hypothetical protein